MRRTMLAALFAAGVLMAGVAALSAEQETVHAFKVSTIDGEERSLGSYRGKVLLIVNTASRCGLTPQYKGLQALYEEYKDQGLEVLAFPANNFLGQEPGTNAEIKDFCYREYQTTFPLFAKISVAGEDTHPLYGYLTGRSGFPGPIAWNFTKFLVDKNGQVVARFEPRTVPESPEVREKIEAALRAP